MLGASSCLCLYDGCCCRRPLPPPSVSMICRNALPISWPCRSVARMTCRWRSAFGRFAYGAGMNIALASNNELGNAETPAAGSQIEIPALPGIWKQQAGSYPACAGTAGGRRRQRLVRHSRLRQNRSRQDPAMHIAGGRDPEWAPGETRRSPRRWLGSANRSCRRRAIAYR